MLEVEVPVELLGIPNGGAQRRRHSRAASSTRFPCAAPGEHPAGDRARRHLRWRSYTSLHVSDSPAPEGVEFMFEGERTLCVVSVPRARGRDRGGRGPSRPRSSVPRRSRARAPRVPRRAAGPVATRKRRAARNRSSHGAGPMSSRGIGGPARALDDSFPFVGTSARDIAAAFPLFRGHFWERNRNKGRSARARPLPWRSRVVSGRRTESVGAHTLIEKVHEYVSFIVLLLALFRDHGRQSSCADPCRARLCSTR
jgi:hypothetical protein